MIVALSSLQYTKGFPESTDYLPNGRECEDDYGDHDYNPCKQGYYCADDDLCNFKGKDCCKLTPENVVVPESTDYLPNGRECEDDYGDHDYNPCKQGYYCADDDLCNFRGRDCCKLTPNNVVVCDKDYECPRGQFCDEKNCPYGLGTDCCGRFDWVLHCKCYDIQTIKGAYSYHLQ